MPPCPSSCGKRARNPRFILRRRRRRRQRCSHIYSYLQARAIPAIKLGDVQVAVAVLRVDRGIGAHDQRISEEAGGVMA